MKNESPVMVVGATGFLGTEICRQLIALHKDVKALVRSTSDPSKVSHLTAMGVETVTGDMKDLPSLEQAFSGVGAVISTASSTLSRVEGDSIETVDRQGQLNVVEAAKKNGVPQIVFISFLHSAEASPLQDAKREVEQRIIESGMKYTILRPTFFMEVWLGPHLGFDVQNAAATIYGDGENKISWIAIKDVAAFAVGSLESESLQNRTIDLGGPQALSPLEVVRLFEEQLEKLFQLQHVPVSALRAQYEAAQDPLQKSFSSLMLTYASGAPVRMEETLKSFPLHMTSVKDYRDMLLGVVAVV